MKNLIHDEKIFNDFVSWLPNLQNDEVYFISLSARNKYLSQSEREEYGLGRTEMFSRCIAYDKDGLSYAMHKMSSSLDYRMTKGGKQIPQHALVVYLNVNPSSTIKAFSLFKSQMDNVLQETLFAKLENRNPDFNAFQRIEKHLMNAVQKSLSRKLIIDIDIDTKDEKILDSMYEFLSGCSCLIIETHGGFHILIDKSTLDKRNIHQRCVELSELSGKEVAINKNGMIPVPGTLQAGKLVTFRK